MIKRDSNSLETIPGVGKKLAQYFQDTGIQNVSDLKNKNPEDIYQAICVNHGYKVDRCVLYVCRCAVYFAENKKHDPEKLKWWNWKD